MIFSASMRRSTICTRLIASAVMVFGLIVPMGAAAVQTPAQTTGKARKNKPTTSPAPTTQQIAEAKAKGLVWANSSTRVYHKDGAYFGNTKRGSFMTEADAIKDGYRAAKTPGSKKKAAGK